MKTLNRIKHLLVAAAVSSCVTERAQAHAISLGYENAGAGSVNIWLGTYIHTGHHLEGSLTLEGVGGNPFPSTTMPFTLLVGEGTPAGGGKPAGLVDGVNNFFVQGSSQPNTLPLVGSDASWLSAFPGLPAEHWQGVNFTGLGPGSYQFTWTPIANPSAEWSLWSSQMNGIFDLSGVVQPPPPPNGVPDAGSAGCMLAFAMAGIAALRRSKGA